MAPIFTIKTPEQWFKMIKAQDFKEFQKALEWDGLPYFNITYADKDDNVFYIFNGLFPKRQPGFDWRGVLPGNTSKTLWTEYIPLNERPQIKNPDCGYVYNVNHTPFKCTCENEWLPRNNYDSLVAYDQLTDDNIRSLRFRDIYEDGSKLSMEDLKAIKYDAGYPEIGYVKMFRKIQKAENSKYQDLLNLFKHWNYVNDLESVAPTIAYLLIKWHQKDDPFTLKEFNEGDLIDKIWPGLEYVQNHLIKHFGKIEVPFKEFYRFKRGDKELPIYGGSGVLAARWGGVDEENGKFYASGGDQFMMFIQYDKTGVVEFESIVPFGSSTVPTSKHYTDQMELYSQQKAKKLTFDKAEIMKNAEPYLCTKVIEAMDF